MKYSIDFHNNKISGWVEYPSTVKRVVLARSDRSTEVTDIRFARPDVVSANCSKYETCGFAFDNLIHASDYDGNFLRVTIETDSSLYQKSIFIGDRNIWQKVFDDFEIKNRKDFSIQNESPCYIFSNNKDIVSLKMLLIRLRRGKRGFGWRGRFSGNEYDEMKNDWVFFKNFYSDHFSNLKDILSVRSIWSILDTFVDYGDDSERLCALAVSNFLSQERLAQTLHKIFKFEMLDSIKLDGQSPYWGGMLSNNLASDDFLDVFLTRNIEALEISPIIKKTAFVIFLNAIESDNSILNINIKFSPYFNDTIKYYKNNFENYIKKQ